MLILLDELLRKILMDCVSRLREVRPGQPPASVTEDQVRFEPPDSQWRTSLGTLRRNALNVYLVDLRENRKLRSNMRVYSRKNGILITGLYSC